MNTKRRLAGTQPRQAALEDPIPSSNPFGFGQWNRPISLSNREETKTRLPNGIGVIHHEQNRSDPELLHRQRPNQECIREAGALRANKLLKNPGIPGAAKAAKPRRLSRWRGRREDVDGDSPAWAHGRCRCPCRCRCRCRSRRCRWHSCNPKKKARSPKQRGMQTKSGKKNTRSLS